MCAARVDGRRAQGTAHLESDHVRFRGGATRVRIPFGDIRSVTVDGGSLVVQHVTGELVLEIGPAASKWAEKIRTPRPLLDKLGVKPGMRVALVGGFDDGFVADLCARTTDVSTGRLRAGTDHVFYAAETSTALRRFAHAHRRTAGDSAGEAIVQGAV